MRIIVKENRDIQIISSKSTQNENDVEIMNIELPESLENYNKKIVFITDDGIVWDFIEEENTYTLKKNITKYERVQFYIWLTKDEEDFRSVTKELVFYHNEDASNEITPEEQGAINQILEVLDEEIETVEGLEDNITALIDDVEQRLDSGEFNAKINGVNTINIVAGENIELEQQDDTLTISATGGGAGGTSDYTELENKPSINGVELSGNKTTSDLGIEEYDDTEIKQDVVSLEQDISDINTNITNLDNNKVDKIQGKGLSTNDFTNEYKNDVDSNTSSRHTHSNKNVLDEITSQDITNWNNKSDFSGSYNDLSDKPTIPGKTSDLTNDSGFIDNTVNNLVNYELKANTGTTLSLEINSSTYVMTLQLKNSAGTVLSTGTVDLPLESVVVGGSYDSTNKKVILTLQSGNTIEFSVADLISGLQSEITSSNKLASDLVDDTNQTNKFVTALEKSNWNNKSDFSGSYDDLSDKPTIPTTLAELSEDTTHRVVTDTEKTTWNNKGTYSKPNGGIPKTDLANDIQASLDNADSAIQESDLVDYVKNTDYATNNKGGVVKIDNNYGLYMYNGILIGNPSSYSTYQASSQNLVISKATLENVIAGKQLESNNNKVTSISSSSTNIEYPSALAVYNLFRSIVDADNISY